MSDQTVPSRLSSADLWAGLGVIALGVVGGIATLDIFVPRGISGFLGPRTFPLAVATALLVLGALLVIRTVIRPRPSQDSVGSMRTLTVLSGAVVGYLVLFQTLGFLLSTFIMLSGMFTYLGERRFWLSATVAAALSVLITIGFRDGLNVALPTGPFGF